MNAPAAAPRLSIELVPRSAWCSNLRKFLAPNVWQRLTKIALEGAGNKCEACGSPGKFVGKIRSTGRMKFQLDTHETWHFNEISGVQRLVRNRALCPDCHEAVHIGLAEVNGRAAVAQLRLATVNGWTPEQVSEHETAAWRLWEELNHRDAWKVDIEVLRGIDILAYEAAMAFLATAQSPPSMQKS